MHGGPAEIVDGNILRAKATRPELRLGLALAACYLVLLLALIPWAHASGPEIPQMVTVFQTGIVIADLATSFLLLNQLSETPERSLLLFGCAYLFSAIMAAAHLLTFPGAILAGRPVIGGLQLAAYVFNFWRCGFALLILLGLWFSARPLGEMPASRRSVRLLPLAVIVLSIVTFALATVAEGSLPVLVAGGQFTPLDLALGWAGVGMGLAACAAAWARARSRLFYLWLALALTAFCGDLLVSNFGGGRFTLGWYATRASNFLSACTLFLYFLLRFAAQQRAAIRSARILRERSLSLQLEVARRAEAEERLVQLQKLEALGQLTGGIAHDFNNLLAAIVGNLDLVRRSSAGLGVRAAKWVENALMAADRGKRLTSQLLVFARAQDLELRPVVVSEIIADGRELLERTLGPQVRLSFDLDGARTAVLGDPTQLELALLNLALNARDAMSGVGELRIATSLCRIVDDAELPAGDYVRLSVADTGPGMTADIVARAFDPFFTTKGAGKGTGLGLSQVYGFAQKAGGTARIESRVGGGTTVYLLLRCCEGEAAPSGGGTVSEAEPSDLAATVMVVDDDADVREFLVNFLRETGLNVVQASDGATALGMMHRTRPDLLITDFAMPGLSGAELASKARALHAGLPIIFITGYANTDALDALAGERAFILKKPFRTFELQAVMSEALREEVQA